MRRHVYAASEAVAGVIREPWGSLTWMASGKIGNVDRLTLGRVVIKKGHHNPRHMHLACEEVLYLLAGRLEHSLGDGKVTLGPGDTITVPAGVFHNAVNVGDADADMIVAYSAANRDMVLQK